MDDRTREKLAYLAYIIIVITAIGAILWGWAGLTGGLPYFFNPTTTRIIYGIIGVAGILAGILFIWGIVTVINKPQFEWKHLFTSDWIFY